MTAKSYNRGWEIYRYGNRWFYVDNNKEVKDHWKGRACGHCGKDNTADGHDPCLGELCGVMNVCCGHGTEAEAYVQFEDGTMVTGASALTTAKQLSK